MNNASSKDVYKQLLKDLCDAMDQTSLDQHAIDDLKHTMEYIVKAQKSIDQYLYPEQESPDPKSIDLDQLLKDITNMTKSIRYHEIESGGALIGGRTSYVNITLPTTYQNLIMNVEKCDGVPKLTRMTYEDVRLYFSDLLTPKNQTLHDVNTIVPLGKDVLVTNLPIDITTSPSGAVYIYHSDPLSRCSECNCSSRMIGCIKCNDCQNDILLCAGCMINHMNGENAICTVNPSHNVEWNSCPMSVINLKCDLCNSHDNFEKCIVSSEVYDVDLCPDCAVTPEGLEFVKKYDMKSHPYVMINLNYEFGSVLDWVPIYSNNDSYLTVCLNKDNSMYQCVAISYINSEGDYEYTMLSKNADDFDTIIDTICNVLMVENVTDAFKDSEAEDGIYDKTETTTSLKFMAHTTTKRELLNTVDERAERRKNLSKIIIYNKRKPVTV